MKIKPCFFILAWVFLAVALQAADLGQVKTVHGGYVRQVSQLASTGRLPATNQLWLSISLPLRDPDGLRDFVAQVSDPASPNYRHYVTPEEFAARYGPTEQDYQAVKDFALSNELVITTTFINRLALGVVAPASAVEKAFHVTLRTYHHPTEAREFFAADTEATVDAALPVNNVGGLNNFSRPRSHRAKNHSNHGPRDGSSPDGQGGFIGDDFRNAYVPGTTLTGAGQTVGLFEWDGSYSNAVAAYAQAAGGGRTNIVIQYVLLHGYNGVASTGVDSGEPEVDLDIEMVMAMAPGLSKIVVFEDNPRSFDPTIILTAMAASNSIKSLSSSWGWGQFNTTYTNTDAIFLEMAAQGQSFFSASGDSDAFTVGSNSVNGVDNEDTLDLPASSPYITQVGGTELTMNGAGISYASEIVWNNGDIGGGQSQGDSGGVSSYYAIPPWQTNISMTANQGSTTQRNIPDVAAVADNIYEVTGNNGDGEVLGPAAFADSAAGGTSCAAPLWAAFIALVNQQAAANGQQSVGFINPAIYAIGKGPNYSACFNDTTVGDNEWPSSPSQYSAVTGYDLCTGWGTPKIGLIDALSGPSGIKLLSPQIVGTKFQFQFLSQSGSTNAIQYRTNLATGSWQSFTNIPGDGTLKTISIPLSMFSPSQNGFVRVSTH